MKCPRCDDHVLDEKDRDGVVVDACRRCRGIWLDRGELEKLIAGATAEWDEDRRFARSEGGRMRDDNDHHDHHRDARGASDPYGQREGKRRWFDGLGDLFD